MSYVRPSNEKQRLLLLAGITAVFEILVLPRFASELLQQSAQWPAWAHLLTISAPRLLLMFVLVAALGPFRLRPWFIGFAALYGLLLFVRFWQTEVYVDWKNIVAGTRATLPYLAGMVGILGGLMMRKIDRDSADVRR